MRPSIKAGLVLGILISIYLAILAISGNYGGSPLKYGKYIILIIGLWVYYKSRISDWTYGKHIYHYLRSGAMISLLCGLVAAVTNSMLFLVKPTYSLEKYTLVSSTFSDTLIVDAVIIVEMVVLGLLSAFIIFPLFKNIPQRAKSTSTD